MGALLGQRPETARRGVGAGAAGWVQRRFFSEEVTIAAELGGDAVSEGDVETIHFAVGDAVNADDVLAEIETDLFTVEVRSPRGRAHRPHKVACSCPAEADPPATAVRRLSLRYRGR